MFSDLIHYSASYCMFSPLDSTRISTGEFNITDQVFHGIGMVCIHKRFLELGELFIRKGLWPSNI